MSPIILCHLRHYGRFVHTVPLGRRSQCIRTAPAKRRRHDHDSSRQDLEDCCRRNGGRRSGSGRLQRLLPPALPALGDGDARRVRRALAQGDQGPHDDVRLDRASGERAGGPSDAVPPRLGAALLQRRAARGRWHARLLRPPARAVGHRGRLHPRRRLHRHGIPGPGPAHRQPRSHHGRRARRAALPAGAAPHLGEGAPAHPGPVPAHRRGESRQADRSHGRQRGRGPGSGHRPVARGARRQPAR